MKRNVLGFLRRGMTACGIGPIVLAILYLILQQQAAVETLTVNQVCLGIFSLSALAFIAGGINIVYHIEQLPLMAAISAHGIVLYLDYTIIYLFNGWLGSGLRPFLVFTVCFFVGYAIIWIIICFIIKRNANRLNQKLSQLHMRDQSSLDS